MKHISTYLSILGILISSFSYSQFIVIETITDVACFSDADGTINLSVSGGTTPYTYLWDPTVGSQTTANVTDLIAGSYTVTITDATVADTVLSYVVTEPAQLSLTIASTPDCGACTGTATPTGSGGTGFSYQWSNGATNANQVGLCTGIYSLTIVDNNGCFVAENVTISASGGFNITTTAVDDTCGQCIGKISVQVGAGGTSPYFYDWGNGNTTAAGTANETQLSYCMGSYLIQITDSVGCSTMDSVEIFGQGITSINTTITDANCGQSDGSIVTAVVGGITPYLYAWSNGSMSSTLSGVSAGSYQLTVSDAGSCNFVTTINLTDISAPTLSIIPNDASCFDGCDGAASGFASGGTAPYSFLWDNTQSTAGVTALCAGISYGLTVTDNNGCNAIATTIVSAPMQLSVTLLVTNSLCNSSSGNIQSNVSGGTPGYTYFWGDGSTAANAINLVAGSYVLTVMDNNGCSSVASATVSSGSSLTLTSSSNAANCSACDGDATISVTGGVTPYLYAWAQGGSTSALATGLCAGSYSVTVSDFNGCSVDSAITVNSVSGLTGMVTTTDALCSGSADGSASASAISGTTPYSYLWNDPLNQITALANGLAAGAYIVTITDNSGCTYLVNSNISEPTLLVSNNTSNSACGNALGSIVFNVSGGTSPYQYSIDSGSTWLSSTNFDSLSVGLFYAAIRDANLCTIYDSISVDSTSLGVTSTVYQPNYCGQYGTVYAFTNNGTQPYSYSWNIQPQYDYTTSYYNYAALSPGDYTLTVSDALGCTEIVNHSITNLCLPNHISGNVFDDLSSDCVQDAGENSMTGKIVVATPGPYYATTNYAGITNFS
ncbi:MAG: SprB repeat-containing protein [Flavobacteriales bacterium]|nr:SprB repeat-containing protein [Flavobacteriales bacterium]